MVTSPLCDATRKALQRANVVSNLSATLLEQRETGRILVKGTEGSTFRHDPYGMRVLECREYPTPVYTAVKKTPVAVVAAPEVPAAAPKKPEGPRPVVMAAAPKPPMVVKAPVIAAAADAEEGAAAVVPLATCRVLVEFKRGEDVYTSHFPHAVGDYVIVEGDRGQDMGRVLEVLPLKGTSVARVVSIATTKERDTLLALRKEEGAAVRLCQQRVKEHGLRMKIEDVEFQYDGGKVTIYYSSNCAIDFRQLQRQLFRDFRCRVWLRTVPASS